MFDIDFGFLIGLAATALFLAAVWKRKVKGKTSSLVRDQRELEDEVIGTLEDLRQAEQQVAFPALSERERLLETHSLTTRFHTSRGYSEPFVNEIVTALEEEGLNATTYFQELTPLGASFGLIERHGVYELYVQRNQVQKAEEIIQQRFPLRPRG